MKRSQRVALFAGMLVVLLFTAAGAYAAEEGGNASMARATELFKWINFVIVAAVLAWVFLKVTPPMFRTKAEAISSQIAKATEAKAEADRQLREAESKLAQLEQEVAGLRATAQREMATEAERIRNVTRADVERVGVAARAEIEAAERAARVQLKVLAADLAVNGAEKLLADELTPQTQQVLVTSFVESLEGSAN